MQLYVLIDQKESGPHTEQTVRAMLDSDEIQRTTMAWHEGMVDWRPLEDVIALVDLVLPPIPEELPTAIPRSQHSKRGDRRQAAQTMESSTIRTVSGVIALILGLLSIFNIGSCMNAQSRLATFQTSSDPAVGLNMLVQTARGMNEGDPLRGIAGLLDKGQSLQDEVSDSQLGAWLCVIGAGVSGLVFACSGKRSGLFRE